ncbi:hypothetical protein PG994_007350 [Apiospora phragmitis]|uniref:GPI inositol-deacylase winged helix domain-containing protein n=1 Tax=Apiospora phragmitis TaxID=2905665 RepID=A0ABR1V0J7_9PEZI
MSESFSPLCLWGQWLRGNLVDGLQAPFRRLSTAGVPSDKSEESFPITTHHPLLPFSSRVDVFLFSRLGHAHESVSALRFGVRGLVAQVESPTRHPPFRVGSWSPSCTRNKTKRPLRLDEAVDALAVDTSSQPRFDAANRTVIPEKIATYCAGLVILVKRQAEDNKTTVTEIQLAHFSVQEYLTSGRLEGSIANDLQETAARLSIMTVCLSYLLDMGYPYTISGARQQYPMAQYSTRYWAQNAAVIEGSDKQVAIVKEYFSHWTAFEFGYRLYRPDRSREEEPDDYKEPVTCLYYATVYGLFHSAKELLETGAEVNAQGGNFGNALQAASLGGHEAIVRLLLEKGAEVNAQGRHYGNALQAALYEPDEATVRLLLEKGAEVHADAPPQQQPAHAPIYATDDDRSTMALSSGMYPAYFPPSP